MRFPVRIDLLANPANKCRECEQSCPAREKPDFTGRAFCLSPKGDELTYRRSDRGQARLLRTRNPPRKHACSIPRRRAAIVQVSTSICIRSPNDRLRHSTVLPSDPRSSFHYPSMTGYQGAWFAFEISLNSPCFRARLSCRGATGLLGD